MSQIAVFFIGQNEASEFGLSHTNLLTKFQECPNNSITKVFASNDFNIFSDNDYKQIWSAGFNRYGQCGVGKEVENILTYTRITYFKQNKINIQKICVSICGDSTYFISDKGKLYGCGKHYDQCLGINNEPILHSPAPIDELNDVIDVESNGSCTIVLRTFDKKQIMLILSY